MPMSSLRWAELPPPPKNGRDADDETDTNFVNAWLELFMANWVSFSL